MKQAITRDLALRLFTYDPLTGVLTWKSRPRSDFKSKLAHQCFEKRFAGKPAGCLNSLGYLVVGVNYRLIGVHRIVLLMVTGETPKVVDHINGIKNDNRLSNLRMATSAQNIWNQKRRSSNTSGVKGVSFNKKLGTWRAYLDCNGHQKHFGGFVTLEDAKQFIERKRLEMHGSFANNG